MIVCLLFVFLSALAAAILLRGRLTAIPLKVFIAVPGLSLLFFLSIILFLQYGPKDYLLWLHERGLPHGWVDTWALGLYLLVSSLVFLVSFPFVAVAIYVRARQTS